ncbi:MAG: hypothetical protein WCH99_15005 [Verrucomicrobiota bacterium]
MSQHPDNASVLESNVAGGRHHPAGGPTSNMQATGGGDSDGTETFSVRLRVTMPGATRKFSRIVLTPVP